MTSSGTSGTRDVGIRMTSPRAWRAFDRVTLAEIGPEHPTRYEAQAYAEMRQESTYSPSAPAAERETLILWSDNAGPVPARVHVDGRCTVDAAGMLAIIAACTEPADVALRAIVGDDAACDTVYGLATIEPDRDGRYDILPAVGTIEECDERGYATGAEIVGAS